MPVRATPLNQTIETEDLLTIWTRMGLSYTADLQYLKFFHVVFDSFPLGGR